MFLSKLSELPFPCAETLFWHQPSGTYGLWGDRVSASGSDDDNEVLEHTVTFELYYPHTAPDPGAHSALQDLLDDEGIEWTKDARLFLEAEQLFMTTYHFTFYERKEIA